MLDGHQSSSPGRWMIVEATPLKEPVYLSASHGDQGSVYDRANFAFQPNGDPQDVSSRALKLESVPSSSYHFIRHPACSTCFIVARSNRGVVLYNTPFMASALHCELGSLVLAVMQVILVL